MEDDQDWEDTGAVAQSDEFVDDGYEQQQEEDIQHDVELQDVIQEEEHERNRQIEEVDESMHRMDLASDISSEVQRDAAKQEVLEREEAERQRRVLEDAHIDFEARSARRASIEMAEAAQIAEQMRRTGEDAAEEEKHRMDLASDISSEVQRDAAKQEVLEREEAERKRRVLEDAHIDFEARSARRASIEMADAAEVEEQLRRTSPDSKAEESHRMNLAVDASEKVQRELAKKEALEREEAERQRRLLEDAALEVEVRRERRKSIEIADAAAVEEQIRRSGPGASAEEAIRREKAQELASVVERSSVKKLILEKEEAERKRRELENASIDRAARMERRASIEMATAAVAQEQVRRAGSKDEESARQSLAADVSSSVEREMAKKSAKEAEEAERKRRVLEDAAIDMEGRRERRKSVEIAEAAQFQEQMRRTSPSAQAEEMTRKKVATAVSSTVSSARGQKLGNYRERFGELCTKSIEDQTEFFLKSFIFALGDNYKAVNKLGDTFREYLKGANEKVDLDPVQAADYLQKNGKTRTAAERKEELADIDLDKNGRIGFIEYLLLHYKVMILSEYMKRTGESLAVDLTTDGVGVVGVGDAILEELFTMPAGLSEELEKAIEEFMQMKREQAELLRSLEEKAAAGGVKGLTAANEIAQIKAKDNTEMNKTELTLQAAKRKAERDGPQTADALLAKKRQEEAEAAEAKKKASREALAARAAMFNKPKA